MEQAGESGYIWINKKIYWEETCVKEKIYVYSMYTRNIASKPYLMECAGVDKDDDWQTRAI